VESERYFKQHKVVPVEDRRSTGLPQTRVARWFVFKPKIPIWEKIQDLRLENVDIFYGHWE
jgi:hypothetical protein